MADSSSPATQPEGPAAAVRAFDAAVTRGDAAAVAGRIAAVNEDERLLKPGLADVCATVGPFHHAMTDHYGAAAKGKWGDGGNALNVTRDAVQGEQATVTTPDAKTPATVALVRQDGQWRLTFAGVAAVMGLRQVDATVPPDEPLRRLIEMREAMRAVTADVRAGRFATAEAAADAGKKAMADAARGAQAQ